VTVELKAMKIASPAQTLQTSEMTMIRKFNTLKSLI